MFSGMSAGIELIIVQIEEYFLEGRGLIDVQISCNFPSLLYLADS